MYAAADKGLYKSLDGGNGWRRILSTNTHDNDHLLSTAEESEDPHEIEGGRTIKSIVIDPSNSEIIYIATSEGLCISRDGGGTWKRTGSLGLGSLDIRHILLDGDKNRHIYAATDRGVFRYSEASDIWQELYKGLISADAYYLALSPGHEAGSKTIWAATDKGVFKASIPVQSPDSITVPVKSAAAHDHLREMDVLSLFSHEPTIEEVMDAAMRYAEVEPEKIAHWREAAARRAWLPDLRFAYDKNNDWQSSSYFYSTSSEKYKDNDITSGRDDGWSVSVTWELGELIWNNDQTSIDSRSKLMVQLRDDVLNEVTRLYFERRRLQVGTLLSPPEGRADAIERELRLQELTADLDALTGSYFSRKMKQGERQ